MTRRQFAAAPAVFLQRSPERPNIIFLLTDDHRWDALGCMGNPIIRTPNIDALSQRGVTFNNHFVTTSICMCSRASFFTGQYTRTHQINDFKTPFTPQQLAQTYPMLLGAAGYRAGFIGKYGVGNDMPVKSFDYWAGFPGQGRYFTKRGDQPIHLTRLMGDQAVEFLAGCRKDQPFCLSVSFKAPHVQDEDPRQFLFDPVHADWYKEVTIPVPKTADPKYISALPLEVQRSENRRRWAVRFSTPELYQESVKAYYRLITEVDLVTGKIVDYLGRMGAAENTVILFSGDNGFYLGEHGLAGKWFMHEESIRTPLIVHDPRLPAARRGARRDEMVLNIDFAPTVLELAGLKPLPAMQGQSLLPLLEGKKPAWRTEWFYEHTYTNGWIPQTEGVRTERWKYTRYLDTTPLFEELFDLSSDPQETNNLARDPRHAAQLDALRARWQHWRTTLEKHPA